MTEEKIKKPSQAIAEKGGGQQAERERRQAAGKAYAISKRSHEKHEGGQEYAESVIAHFDDYATAYKEAHRLLDATKGRRVMFLQLFEGGRLKREYVLRKSRTKAGDGTIEGEALEMDNIRKAERRRKIKEDAKAKAEAEGRPYDEVFKELYRQALEAERQERKRINREIMETNRAKQTKKGEKKDA